MNDLNTYFKSIVEQDKCAVVICDMNDIIIYLNPAAKERYKKHGELVGKSIMDCHNEHSRAKIREVVDWFKQSEENNIMFTYHNAKENKDVYMVALRGENKELIGYYEKHEYRTLENEK